MTLTGVRSFKRGERWTCVSCHVRSWVFKRGALPKGWSLACVDETSDSDNLFRDADAYSLCARCTAMARRVLGLPPPKVPPRRRRSVYGKV